MAETSRGTPRGEGPALPRPKGHSEKRVLRGDRGQPWLRSVDSEHVSRAIEPREPYVAGRRRQEGGRQHCASSSTGVIERGARARVPQEPGRPRSLHRRVVIAREGNEATMTANGESERSNTEEAGEP